MTPCWEWRGRWSVGEAQAIWSQLLTGPKILSAPFCLYRKKEARVTVRKQETERRGGRLLTADVLKNRIGLYYHPPSQCSVSSATCLSEREPLKSELLFLIPSIDGWPLSRRSEERQSCSRWTELVSSSVLYACLRLSLDLAPEPRGGRGGG